MNISETLSAPDRPAWRSWLAVHHASAREIWLVSVTGQPSVAYLDAVEEALCFGWIDGLAKRLDARQLAQRFTPRRRGSHWTELNKNRARRLIRQGRMTPAGRAALPDLSLAAFIVAPDVRAALQADPVVWRHFCTLPASYVRVRVGYIEEMRRRPDIFQTRLGQFLRQTRRGRRFGVTR